MESQSEKTPSRRKRGRPAAKDHHRCTLFSYLDLMEIERLYLQNVPLRAIAAKFGVAKNTIQNQITAHIRPAWKERLDRMRDEELAKVSLLERIAWERFEQSKLPQTRVTLEKEAIANGADPATVSKILNRTGKRTLARVGRTGEACWLQVVQWCIDWRARISGAYAAQKLEHVVSGDLRVAGTTAEEFSREALSELIQAVEERKKRGSRTSKPEP